MLSEQITVTFFWLAIAIYISSFIFYAAKIKLPSKSYLKWATGLLISGLVAQTISIIFLFVSARGFGQANSFELLLFISWFVVLEALMVELWSKVRILGFYASLLAIILLLVGWSRYKVPGSLFQNLKSTWVIIHVALIIIAYAAFIIAAGAAFFYLLQERQLKSKKPSALQRYLPSLEVLDEAAYRTIVGGFVIFSITLVLGFSMAFKFWQSGWDINILISALATWVLYIFYLYSRLKMGWVGVKSSYVAMSGLIPIALTSIITYLSNLQ